MPHRPHPFIWKLPIILIGALVLTIGATWRGVTDPTLARLTVIALGGALVAWLAGRRWSWPRTALDGVLPLWAFALIVSSAANPDGWKDSVSGLWFVGMYIVVWYALQDGLAQRRVTPTALIDWLLLATLPVIASAFIQAAATPTVRVSGVLENPNNLGGFLVLILPLTAARLTTATGWRRIGVGVYALAGGLALLLTDSRGGMFGLATALLTVGAIRYHRPAVRAGLLAAYALTVILLIVVRGDSGRLPIYTDVLATIAQHPITGTGLFTFRLATPQGQPPVTTSLYVHNLILHVAVELGLSGLIALAASGLRLARRRPAWGDDPARLWAYAAIVGAGAHQLVDFPVMMPAIALTALTVLAIALPPEGTHRRRWPVYAVAAAALVLIICGLAGAPLRINW